MQNELTNQIHTEASLPDENCIAPFFELGRIVATPGSLAHCAKNNISPLTLIGRHLRCDWGELCDDDWTANQNALFTGGRLLSVYRVDDEKIYCITEWDRSVTTLLLVGEY